MKKLLLNSNCGLFQSNGKLVAVFVFILTLAVSNLTFAQPGNMSINQDVSGTYANTACTLKGGVYQARFQENATGTSSGTRNWQFNSDGYSNNWGTQSSTKTLSGYNATIAPNTATASGNWVAAGFNGFGKLPATLANNYYTYNLIKGSSYASQRMAVLETSFNPVAVNSVAQTAGSYGGRVVGITTSATPNASENIYVRYSTNGYSSSTIVQATGSGTAWNATIPWQSGAVSFYVYTSNKSKATIDAEVTSFSSQEIHDLSTLNSNNNAGANYSWTPAAGNFIVTSPAGTFAAGIGYPSLTLAGGAFAALNAAATGTGPVTILQTGDSTLETGATALAGSTNWTSLTLNPSGARTISGAGAAGAPLISFAGADNVTFNGLNASGNSLTISNTTVSGTTLTSTISFTLDANNNTITNCTVLGSAIPTALVTAGTIYFGAGTTTGNDNNTISNCNIGPAGANLPNRAVFFGGTSNTVANNGNIVSNNNIFDYFSATLVSSGVYITSFTTDATISGNKFYQTASRTQTTGSNHAAIYIANTTTTLGYTVTGNTIGFANAAGTGSYGLVGISGTIFTPIYLNVGTTVATSIQGNVIKGIAVSGAMSGTSSSSSFTGIYVANGLTTIGDVTGNTFGDMTTTGSITFTSSSTSTADVNGIFNFGSSAWTTNNNNIGGVTVGNSSTAPANFYGLRCNTASTLTWTATGNTIGGTVANSINSTSTATSTIVNGILVTAPIGTITSNTIQNMTVAGGTGTTTLASMAGIVVATASANQTITSNTIANLSNTNTTAATIVTGLQMTGSTANVVSRNNIYNLSSSTTSAAAEINGIRVGGGTTVYSNNMIALGTGVSNALGAANSNSSTAGLIGINEFLGTDSFFNNSVYIGGTATAGLGASIAFNGVQTTNTRSFRNNIFVNNRTNSGATGKHYSVKINGTALNPSGLTINNNVYFGNGTGYVLGFFNSADVTSLGAWQTAVGQDAASFNADPKLLNPTSVTTPDLHINPASSTPVEATGVDLGITIDIDGQTRSGLTPVDIGADAGNFTPLALCVAPANQATSLVVGAVTSLTVAASFTAAASAPAGYLSVISQGALVGSPVDGTTYAANSAVGSNGLAVQSSASTSITANSASNTTGTVTIFSYNSGSCSGGPKYNLVAPLTATATTCPLPPAAPVTTLITNSGFTPTWTASSAGGSAFAITYFVDVTTDAAYATPVAGSPFSTTSTSLAITGLNAATPYYWRVRANNTVCSSAYLNNGLVTTACGSVTVPYFEGFEGITVANTLPTCMDASPVISLGTKTRSFIAAATGTNAALIARTGSKFVSVNWSPAATGGYFFSVPLQLTGGVSYTSTVYYRTDATAWTDVTMYYGTSATTAAMTNTVATIANTASTTYVPLSGAFTPPTTGVYYLGFRAFNATTAPNYCSFDDFTVDVSPSCLPPTLTATSAITDTTASINWTAASPAPSNGYKYEIRTSGAAGSGASGLTTSGTTGAGILTANVTGLTAATSYSVYAQSDCGGSTSAWTSAGTFVSACAVPNNPGAITVTLPSATGFTLNYAAASPAPTSYILFNTTGTTATAIPTLVTGTTYVNATAYTLGANSYNCITNTSVSPIALTGGVSNTQYNYFLFSKTSTNSCFGAPYYSSGVTVSAITCPAAPTVFVNSAITTSGATVSWTASAVGGGAGTINYILEVYTDSGYTTAISGSPFSVGTAVTKNLTGLSAGATYYYRVKANNGSCDSVYLSSGVVSTLCNTITSFPYAMPFDGSAACWTVSTGTAPWALGSTSTDITAPQSGSGFIYKPFTTSTQYLYSAPINLSSFGANQSRINFWIYRNSLTVSADQVSFKINTTNSNVGATNLQTYSILSTVSPAETISGWYNYKVDIPASWNSAGTVFIVIEGVTTAGSSSYDIGLDNFVLEQKPDPITITPSPSATICNGASTSLTASSAAAYTYTWSPATGLSATSGATVTASPTTTTTYTVTGVAGAMNTTQTITVTVNPSPAAVTITPSAAVCPNAITTLTASSISGSATTTIIGTQSGTTAVSAISPYRLAVTTASRNQYFYTKAELNAAGITGAQNITSLAFDVTSTSGFVTMPGYEIKCANTTSTGVATTYAYTGGAFTTVYSGTSITPTTGLNTYTFTTPFAWDGTSNIIINICLTSSGTAGTTLSVKAMGSVSPVASVGNSGTGVCTAVSGATTNGVRPLITLGYTSVVNAPITWLPTTDLYTDAGATVAYTGTAAGTVYSKATTTQTYTATATLGSCTKTNATTITVKTPVAITSATAATSLICLSDTTTLTANGVVGTGAVVTWWSSTGGTGTSYGTGLTKILGPGTYYARVTGDCGLPAEASVTVGAKVNVGIINITALVNPICFNATTTLSANGVIGTNALVTWYTGAGGTGTNLGASNSLVAGPGTYYARVTGDCGAPVEANYVINFIPGFTYANLQFPGAATICESGTLSAYGKVYKAGVTDAVGQGAGITVEYGYSTSNTNPSTWTNWSTASYNGDLGNDDEYTFTFTPPASGTFYYTFRYSTTGCASWQYGGYSASGGNFWDGTTYVNGQLTVNPNLPASVSTVVAPTGAICSGTSVTFTATPTNGGATPAYQWKVNGTNVFGETAATFTTTTLANSDVVTVALTSNATPCSTGSPVTSSGITMTVNPNLPASVSTVVAPTGSICTGTSVTFTATPTNGGATPAYQWKVNGTNVFGQTASTFTTTTLANSDVVTVELTSNATPCLTGSPVTSSGITMTVNAPLTPTFATATSVCYGDTAFSLPLTSTEGITGTWNPSFDNLNSNTYNFTPTSGQCATVTSLAITITAPSIVPVFTQVAAICNGDIIAGLPLTSNNGISGIWLPAIDNTVTTVYTFTPTTGQCATTATMTIAVGTTTTWVGLPTGWNNGVPTSTSSAVIAAPYSVAANITACTLSVSAVVTIPSGFNVDLQGAITVNSGSFTLSNNANLIQSRNVTNSGNIIVKRETSPLKRLDYALWSAPVAGQFLQSFSPGTVSNRFLTYNPTTDQYNVVALPASTAFALGTGYLIRVPNTHPTTATILSRTFTGVPNNGPVALSVATNSYNGIGNPYPSTISADAFITANNLTEALYFWRKDNNLNQSMSPTTSYATYTLAGGVGTAANIVGGSSLVPNGIIQVGQGFIAKATSTSLNFTNAMRIANNGNQFFRTAEDRSRVWLNLTNTDGLFSQALVAYMPNATSGIDAAIDGRLLNDNANGSALSSLIDNQEFAVQGRALPFETTDVVPMAFKAASTGNYTIAVDHTDGLFTTNTQAIYLKDNLLATTTDLATPYTFASNAGSFNNRFVIVYQPAGTLATTIPTLNDTNVIVYKQNENIVINTSKIAMASVKIFDIRGRLLIEKSNINATEIKINSVAANQVLIVKVTSTNNEVVTKKVIN